MANSYTYIPYDETGYFSHLVTDYLKDHNDIKQFYRYAPNVAGLKASIDDRSKHPVDRKLLVDTLMQQYSKMSKHQKTEENISLLLNENTFTVCTAHQPNLLTGYLYFVYKILHAIKLTEELTAQYPDKRFVPVYYMGSEDNDIEELGTFRFRDKKYVWDGAGQEGAVGRMNTKSLATILNELFRQFGPPGKNCDQLQKLITTAYLQHTTISDATQYLVHELFGRYGLLVLNPDEAALKAKFNHVTEEEILLGLSYPVVTKQAELLAVNYKVQANPRAINLFYLTNNLRERIENIGEKWFVVNTDIKWTKTEILNELKEHPERFSPNVVLRGLFQETILPDVAFIGGGAEVAYWLQLKTLFEKYNIFYPCILLRQSVLWIRPIEKKLRQRMDLSILDVFRKEEDLIRDYVSKHATDDWQTTEATKSIDVILKSLEKKATIIDPTLEGSAAAVIAKINHQLIQLEKKMLRAQKRKMSIQVDRIGKLKKSLFPNNSLQERIDNFMEYYLEYGTDFFEIIKKGIKPLDSKILVVE